MAKGLLLYGYSVTPLHPGVGRTPGAVDLPVQRDPMGYPMVYASSVKGAFKAECARQQGCIDTESGRADCSRCPLCCCLFGHELGGEPAAGLLSVLDMVPLFLPVPSLSHGYLYVTTPYLAARAAAILDTIGGSDELKQFLEEVKGLMLGEGQAAVCSGIGGEVYVGTTRLSIARGLDCSALSSLAGLGGLASSLPARTIVVSDTDGPMLVEKGLIRLTRVKLRADTKTVSGQALWTEEYIPQGAVFLSGFLASTPRRNKYCCEALGIEERIISDKEAEELISKFLDAIGAADYTAYAVVGGKETIGKGLLKLVIKPPKEGKG